MVHVNMALCRRYSALLEEVFHFQDRSAFNEDLLPGLTEIVMDEELAVAIHKASRTSMGMDASPVDMSNIVTFCDRMVKLAEYRRDLNAYLVDKVKEASTKSILF